MTQEQTATRSAAETIAAAIEKLERLRDAATPGPYDFEDDWQPPQWKASGWTYVRVVAGEPNSISGVRGMVLSTDGTLPGSEGKARTLADAELIVTLHRTIDAQLAVLRSSLDWFEKAQGEWPQTTWEKHPELGEALDGLLRQELELARAILGEA